MNDEIKTIHVHMQGPSRANGVPIGLNGKRFRRRFGTQSGELSEREVARMMTLEIRNELKRSAYSRITGFSGPIPYPRGF
jgi:hypothetical protein